jgi:hypothetical protein
MDKDKTEIKKQLRIANWTEISTVEDLPYLSIMKVSAILLLLFVAPFSAHTHEQITLHAPHAIEKRVAIIGKL